jgi:hypothetical protein
LWNPRPRHHESHSPPGPYMHAVFQTRRGLTIDQGGDPESTQEGVAGYAQWVTAGHENPFALRLRVSNE